MLISRLTFFGQNVVARPSKKPLCIAATCSLALSSCALSPPYQAPTPPATRDYTATPTPAKTATAPGPGGAAQSFVYGKGPQSQWWRLYGSSELDQLVDRAIQNSPTVAAAAAKLRQAEAATRANEGIFYPQVNGNLSATRQKNSTASYSGRGPGNIFSVYNGNVAVTYYPDFFGVNRLVYKGSLAQQDFQRYELEAARLSLTGNVVNAYLGAVAAEAQIEATRAIVQGQKNLLGLVRAQYHAGAAPYLNVVNQEAQLASAEATLPPLQQGLSQYRHQLAVLVGDLPSNFQVQPAQLDSLHLPGRIPVSLPAELVRQRPDIRAAEAQLRYANAQVGVAVAQMYPSLSLTGTFGQSSLTLGKFLDSMSNIWSLAANLTAPIFRGGTLEAQKEEAKAAFDATLAQYQQTVLGAFQQVADAMRAVEHDAQTLNAQGRSLRAAQEGLNLAQTSYRAGALDYLSLLSAQVQYQTARIAYVRVQAQRYQDTGALFLALGGGWQTGSGTQNGPSMGDSGVTQAPAGAYNGTKTVETK